MEIGDVILRVNGLETVEARDVSRAVADLAPGDEARLLIWRDGRERDVRVTIGLFPEETDIAEASAPDAVGDALGLALARADQGVLVERVDPLSDAAAKGVRPGDIIVEVGGKRVETPRDVEQRVKEAEEQERGSVLLLLRNNERQRFVALTLKDA